PHNLFRHPENRDRAVESSVRTKASQDRIDFSSFRVSPCSGCETGHPSPPFALRSGDNLYVPRTPRSGATASALRASARPLR
ncbi:MAG: hypothetical protein, partial [Olavius algarvensis Gamma 1 endosymbiont]